MGANASRPDSLVALLIRRKLFEEFSQWCFSSRPTLEEREAWLKERKIERSNRALSEMQRAPEWRMAQAAWERARLDASLPADLEETMRKSLLDQRFNAVLGELTHEQLMDHLKVQLEEAKLKLKGEDSAFARQKFRRETCELFLEWHANEQAKAIAAGSGTHEEKIAALGQAMFPDWDEE